MPYSVDPYRQQREEHERRWLRETDDYHNLQLASLALLYAAFERPEIKNSAGGVRVELQVAAAQLRNFTPSDEVMTSLSDELRFIITETERDFGKESGSILVMGNRVALDPLKLAYRSYRLGKTRLHLVPRHLGSLFSPFISLDEDDDAEVIETMVRFHEDGMSANDALAAARALSH